MLASTVQFSNNTQDLLTTAAPAGKKTRGMTRGEDLVVSFAWKERLFFQDPTVCRYITRRPVTEYQPIRGRGCQRSTHELQPDYM